MYDADLDYAARSPLQEQRGDYQRTVSHTRAILKSEEV